MSVTVEDVKREREGMEGMMSKESCEFVLEEVSKSIQEILDDENIQAIIRDYVNHKYPKDVINHSRTLYRVSIGRPVLRCQLVSVIFLLMDCDGK